VKIYINSMIRCWLIALLTSATLLTYAQCPVGDFTIHGEPSALSACPLQVLDIQNQSTNAVSYEWDFCAGDMGTTPSGTLVSTLTGIQSYDAVKILKESGSQYYGFIVKQSSGGLFRLNFGSDLSQSPTPESLGALGLAGASDVEFINDQGTWYALVATGNNLVRLKFTSGLGGASNTITSSNLGNFGGLINSVRGLSLVKDGANYYALATSSTLNTLTVVKFTGTMEGSTSSVTTTVPGSSQLLAINMYRECSIWYGVVTSPGNSRLIKIMLGTDLMNTSGFQFSTQSGVSIQAYGMDLLLENGKYYVFLVTIGSPSILYQLDFGNSIWLNNPTVNNRGSLSGLAACIAMDFLIKDSQVIGFIGNRSNYQLHRISYPNNCSASNPTSSLPNPNDIFYSNNGNYSIELKAFDADNNFSVVSKSFQVSPAPAVNFSSDKNCLLQDVLFNDESVVGSPGQSIESWMWNFDGLGNSSGQNPKFQFPAAATYSITLQVIDSRGCISATTQSVKIYSNTDIQPAFTYDPTVCSGGNENFYDASTSTEDAVVGWTWDFNNGGGSSNLQNSTFIFSGSGINDVSLTVTGLSGCAYSIVEQVNVIEGPATDFAINGKCTNEVVTFTNQTSGNIAGYIWKLDDIEFSTEINTTLTFAALGQHNITLSSVGNNGCISELIKPLTIYSVPQPDFFINLPPFSCNGTPTQFNDATLPLTDSNITSWQWNFNDGSGATSTQQNPQHTYDVAGIYDVSLRVETNFGCSSAIQIPIEISVSPKANFSFGPACLNKGTQFQGTSDAVISAWKWTIDNTFYGFPEPTHTFNFSGNYPVTLTVVGANDCEGTLTKAVEIKPTPLLDFNTTLACSNAETIFADQTTGVDLPQTWQWSFESNVTGEGSPASYTFASAGAKPVKMSIVTQSGCEYWLIKNVVVAPSPTAAFTTSETFGAPPLAIEFNNTSLNASGYSWNFGVNNAGSTESDPTFTYTQLGEYLIELTATNGAGCSDVATQSIQVLVPRYNLSLENLMIQEGSSSNAKVPVVTITNNSNVRIGETDIWVTGSSGLRLKSKVDLNLSPGSMQELTLPLEVFSSEKFICVELNLIADTDLTDNQRCENLMGQPVVVVPYPNPTLGVFWLDIILEEAGSGSLKIADSMGKTIFTQEFENLLQGMNHVEIDFSNQRPGLYIAIWNVGGKQTEFRFIRQ
jgi:PKD repeat protein